MIFYYLSGPMRGHPEHNYPAFFSAERALSAELAAQDAEFILVNPARNFGGDRSLATETYLEEDVRLVLGSDVLVILPGWETSEGAQLEIAIGKAIGRRFMLAERTEPDGWSFCHLDGAPAVRMPPRAELLDAVKVLVTGDRNNAYGPPMQDFQRSAGALNAYGYRGPGGRSLLPHDIAVFIAAVKISRIMWCPEKADNWADLAGYAACGHECVVTGTGSGI